MQKVTRKQIIKSTIFGVLISFIGGYVAHATNKPSTPTHTQIALNSDNSSKKHQRSVEGWADLPNGSFTTNDSADLITYRVYHNAVSEKEVEFKLVVGHTTSGWAKAIIMPDGQGSQWVIRAEGQGGSARNTLWANQVLNGQVLTFRKPKAFGIWYSVKEVGYLEYLDPGDRVVFTWERD
jgi:hypothetical protein